MGNQLCTDKCVDYCVSKVDSEYHCSYDLQFFGMDGLFGILASLSTCRKPEGWGRLCFISAPGRSFHVGQLTQSEFSWNSEK